MKTPRSPLDSIVALLRRVPKGAPAVGMTPHTHRRLRGFSKGMLQRLGYHVPQPEVPADDTNPKGFAEWLSSPSSN